MVAELKSIRRTDEHRTSYACEHEDIWLGLSSDVVGRFLDVMLVERGLSLRTCSQYRAILLGADRWLQRSERCTLISADDRQLVRYLTSWVRGRESLRRLSRVMLGMQRFFAYLCDSHVRNDNPMLSPVAVRWRRRKQPKALTKQLQRASRQATIERDRAMLALMIATELRAADLIELRMEDLRLEEGYLALGSQASSAEQVPLCPALVEILQKFLLGARRTLLKDRECPHVFPSIAGRAMTGQEFWRAFRREAAFAEAPGEGGRLGAWRSRRGSSEISSRHGT